ncbi:hypothetical protein PPTG_22011 [Phytophthora nicotianae INRA-310]|uniref:Uncharacterized protein n=1 Tax=Phytophthora nicotianae (strain INRA-310) TaxID=761204 RepID=W2QPC9_PHYN3|nr:hypothetical protein PPTG_22011 [Phytophthora nicotianae INRA-310]ETN14791.1 hypothetical protein PPTG_22011 [Phytophthora nicotianae INRA-310]
MAFITLHRREGGVTKTDRTIASKSRFNMHGASLTDDALVFAV